MVLVTANIIVFIGILTLIYLLCRLAWGVGSALAAVAVFIAVFGFSQFVGIGNYKGASRRGGPRLDGCLAAPQPARRV
jgi:hypothetical protein